MQVTRIIPDVPSFLAGSLSFDAWSILFLVGQSLVIFLVVVLVAAMMIIYERRMLALWQDLPACELFTRIIVTHVSIRSCDTSSMLYNTPSQAYTTLPYHLKTNSNPQLRLLV